MCVGQRKQNMRHPACIKATDYRVKSTSGPPPRGGTEPTIPRGPTELPYMGTSLIRKRPPPQDHPRTLGISLRQGPRGMRLYQTSLPLLCGGPFECRPGASLPPMGADPVPHGVQTMGAVAPGHSNVPRVCTLHSVGCGPAERPCLCFVVDLARANQSLRWPGPPLRRPSGASPGPDGCRPLYGSV